MSHSYRIELHAHTKETSPCASVSAPDLVARYLAKGYDAVVITDHLSPGYFEKYWDTKDWTGAVDAFLTGYHAVREAAGDKLRVYLGMEIRFPANANDYLVYGFDEAFLRDNFFLHMTSIEKLYELRQGTPIRVFQAHPFRYGMTLTHPRWLDGIEVYNGNPRHNSHNTFAALWAEAHNLPGTCGSDFHDPGDEGRGGILLPYLPEDDVALAAALTDPDKMLMQTPHFPE